MAAKEKSSSRWSAWLAPILFLLAAVAAAPSAPALTCGALETRAWEKTSAPLDSRLDESLQLLNLHQQNGGAGYDNALGSPLAAESAGDLLMPGGNALGQAGSDAAIREVQGGVNEAQTLFNKLAQGGTPVTGSTYPGTLVQLPNGGTVGLRTVMTASPGTAATVDVNIPNIPITKIKFNP